MNRTGRLLEVYQEAPIIPYNSRSRFVIASDCHRGVGNWGDNFMPNQNLFFAALDYYYKRGFSYIELGDGDELWENRSMQQIIQIHSSSFWLLSRFFQTGRLYMMIGNHDKAKESSRFLQLSCSSYFCDSSRREEKLFPAMQVYEGLRLRHCGGGQEIFLAHGHQGDFINDKGWKIGRFLVRYVWRPLELLGINDPTSAAKNHKKKNRIERRLAEWADENGTLLISGHTHRPYFPQPGKGMYFNDGSCVHPRCITNLEIKNNKISLVKWSVMTGRDRNMFVGREVLEKGVDIGEYFV